MAWELLPVDYTDAIWSGLKKYVEVHNEDDTISFQDVTKYSDREKSFFGARDANRMNEALNTIMSMVENGTDLYEAFQNYFETQKAFFESQSDEKLLEFIKYLAELKAQSDKTIDEIKNDYETEMNRYESEQQKLFQMWFDTIRGLLSNDATANLAAAIVDLEASLSAEKSERVLQMDTHTADTSHIRSFTHAATDGVHSLTGTLPESGIATIRFKATSDFAEGGSFTINGADYTAKPTGEEIVIPDKLFVTGDIVTADIDIDNQKLIFSGGTSSGGGKIMQQVKLPISDVYDGSSPQGEWELVFPQADQDKFSKNSMNLSCGDIEKGVIYSGFNYYESPNYYMGISVYHVATNSYEYVLFNVGSSYYNDSYNSSNRLFVYNHELYLIAKEPSSYSNYQMIIYKLNLNTATRTNICAIPHSTGLTSGWTNAYSKSVTQYCRNCCVGNTDYLYFVIQTSVSYKPSSSDTSERSTSALTGYTIHLPTKEITQSRLYPTYANETYIYGGYADEDSCYITVHQRTSASAMQVITVRIRNTAPTVWENYDYPDFPRKLNDYNVFRYYGTVFQIGNTPVYFEANSPMLLSGTATLDYINKTTEPNTFPELPMVGRNDMLFPVAMGDAIYLYGNGTTNTATGYGMWKLGLTQIPPEERPRVWKIFKGDKYNSLYSELTINGLESTGQPAFTITQKTQTADRDYDIHLGQYSLKNSDEVIIVEKK